MNASKSVCCSASTSSRLLRSALAGAALLAFGGCATIPRVTPELTAFAISRWPDTTQEGLLRGREILTTRCNRCHFTPDPKEEPLAEWPDWVRKMGRKSKLDADQQALVLRFILVAREAPPEVLDPPRSKPE